MMGFRTAGLRPAEFADRFAFPADALRARRAVRQVADARLSYPCRISLTDAELGEAVILVNYEHQRADSPYRASHAIYVREGEVTYDAVDAVPDQLRRRTLSLRAFDESGMIVGADLVEGQALEQAVATLLADRRAPYLHAHFATYGCYAPGIERS